MPQLKLPAQLILLMLMEMWLKLRQIFHYADVVLQKKNHFAMAATAMQGLLANNYLAD